MEGTDIMSYKPSIINISNLFPCSEFLDYCTDYYVFGYCIDTRSPFVSRFFFSNASRFCSVITSGNHSKK